MSEILVNYKILLVDDDLRFHKDFREIFGGNFEIDGAINEEGMWEKLKSSFYDLVALDLMLDGKDSRTGLHLIRPLNEKYNIPVVVISAEHDRIISVLTSLKEGAKAFLLKQDLDYKYWKTQFNENIKNSKAKTEIERLLKGDAINKADFIGSSKSILTIREKLEILSQNPHVTVLLTGETGVGKDVAARFMHSCSVRRNNPFIPVNLSALNKSLMESELFGSVKGAYTGSLIDKEGYFKEANGGILMLVHNSGEPVHLNPVKVNTKKGVIQNSVSKGKKLVFLGDSFTQRIAF